MKIINGLIYTILTLKIYINKNYDRELKMFLFPLF